jgi:hypothetical protein
LIVQLGPFEEKVLLLLAAGLRGKEKPKVLSFRGPGAEGDGGHRNQLVFQRLMQRCRLGRMVESTAGHSNDAFVNWHDSIDILCISARADDDALHCDFARVSPFVRPGGVVILHAPAGLPSLSQALAENLRGPGYRDFRQVDGLAWAVKRSGGLPPNIPADATARLQDYARRAAYELAENRHTIQALRRSWSWRLTAPLRLALRTFLAIAGIIQSLGSSPTARMVGLGQWIRFGREVGASGLWDERYYGAHNAGVTWAQELPLLHFFVRGASEGNWPNELFDIEYYTGCYPDVAKSGFNPLVHYLKTGAYQGLDPHPHFDSSFYLEQNPDVREANLNPLAHYLAPGIAEGRDPNPWFDTSEYLEQSPELVDFGLNPLAHYLLQHSKPPSTGRPDHPACSR